MVLSGLQQMLQLFQSQVCLKTLFFFNPHGRYMCLIYGLHMLKQMLIMDINKAQKQICLKNMFIAAYRNYQLHNDQKSNQDIYLFMQQSYDTCQVLTRYKDIFLQFSPINCHNLFNIYLPKCLTKLSFNSRMTVHFFLLQERGHLYIM